ncbi:Mitochondrial import inner membrane translocase subunit TIM50 [Apostasia shenzhenica]|uniref:Mitochondrial import inner membrane translocase subunit TIM50 n=1 Tax=Apostasia shenzhenica TaxID=1088818 RepID=A0A2I0BA99_9ASPA|nr:Mitochondrial import inner membrane translocase subunit TIM50 [Apostasia shenzhenica]
MRIAENRWEIHLFLAIASFFRGLHSAFYSNIEVSSQNIQITEANDRQDTITGDLTQLLKRLQSSPDCASVNEMVLSIEDEQSKLPHLVTDEVDDSSCLREVKDFNAYDFYVTDNVATISFVEDIELSDMIYVTCPDYEDIDSYLMLDVEEGPFLGSFMDKPIESVCLNDDKSTAEHVFDSFDSCIESLDQESQLKCIAGNFEDSACLNLQSFYKNLLDPSSFSISCPPLLVKEMQKGKPITLVLDLDETLVHSKLEHWEHADFTFPVFFNMKQHIVYVRRRPHLQMFLERVAQMFQVVIFTASQSIYAEQLLNILDPDTRLISRRYYRESCIFSDGYCTKDLTILGVDMAKVVIVDNSPQVFRLQVNNGIPIKSWFDDPADQALVSLLPFLETLAVVDDVRPLIAEKFGSSEL